jgi:hypothetical protein
MLQDMIKIKVECLSNDQYDFLKTLWETKSPSQASAAPEEPYVNKAGWLSWDLSQNCCQKRVSVPDAQKGTLININEYYSQPGKKAYLD